MLCLLSYSRIEAAGDAAPARPCLEQLARRARCGTHQVGVRTRSAALGKELGRQDSNLRSPACEADGNVQLPYSPVIVHGPATALASVGVITLALASGREGARSCPLPSMFFLARAAPRLFSFEGPHVVGSTERFGR